MKTKAEQGPTHEAIAGNREAASVASGLSPRGAGGGTPAVHQLLKRATVIGVVVSVILVIAAMAAADGKILAAAMEILFAGLIVFHAAVRD